MFTHDIGFEQHENTGAAIGQEIFGLLVKRSDVIIIGGGIIGLSTAYHLSLRFPEENIILLEKEQTLGSHQTGRNSGVLHAGIYYRPGSLKARLCKEGKQALEQFCSEEAIPWKRCGKVIVATEESEVSLLRVLFEQGQQNGVSCSLINQKDLLELEPHAMGLCAIYLPETGIVNFQDVTKRLAENLKRQGHEIMVGAQVTGFRFVKNQPVVLSTMGEVSASCVINCAGLYSDRVARLAGLYPSARIIPFRGEYYQLNKEASYLCNNLIYPVPNPQFPFLGVHFTRGINGAVECGPNAVLALAREGYSWRKFSLKDTLETLCYPGFIKLSAQYWKTGLCELWRSLSKEAFVQSLQRLVPRVRSEDLESAPAGVRAQTVLESGKLLDDFSIVVNGSMIHVLNAPSPAATASFAIAKYIVDQYYLPLKEERSRCP